jgi:phenylalanyl-tRNA synthetase beta chain
MLVPVSWLREYVDLPRTEEARDIAARLLRAGLEVEAVHGAGNDIGGPLVVGRVDDVAVETHSNGKTIRWCQVDVGEAGPRGIVCGAHNFVEGDLVVVALPGAVLSGGVEITARRTYGHISDGMICSARELGLGEDHTGIVVLRSDEGRPGDDAATVLHLRDDVLDIAVTPDRGYCLSMRGIAREVATAYGVPLTDPGIIEIDLDGSAGYPVAVEGADRCAVYVARTVTGIDVDASSPRWMQRRIQLAGMRPISLSVDVTNYVMLELGQPIHGFDVDALVGPIVVRRASPGEKLTTLDGAIRDLDPDDLLITDDTGPIGLAGVMGGESTEMGPLTRSIVIEAANFEATGIARTARRHKLPSEASRRFERGVDPALPLVAATRVVDLLVELGGARAEPGATVVGSALDPASIEIDSDLPSRVVGVDYPADEVAGLLAAVGGRVTPLDAGRLSIVPPTWRTDLVQPFDLVEEVARLHGYDTIPSVLPVAPPGRGITFAQRLRRRIERAIASAGYVEAPSYPFIGPKDFDALGLHADDARRHALQLANPLSDEEPLLRTTLLPGLLATLKRNVGRGFTDIALFESGLVFRPGSQPLSMPPRLRVDKRPTDDEVRGLLAAVPAQPHRVAIVAAGNWVPDGWWGAARPVSWADAVQAGRVVAAAARVDLDVRHDDHAPWHPGRCAALYVGETLVGHAGELHPRVVQAYGLPDRTVAMELETGLLGAVDAPVPAPNVSTFPVATQDVALVVSADVPAAEVEAGLRSGAGKLLESIRLFDVYEGPQVGEGRKSLAYALRFRAPDRTLTVEETTAARDAAVAEAERRTGALLRSAKGTQ